MQDNADIIMNDIISSKQAEAYIDFVFYSCMTLHAEYLNYWVVLQFCILLLYTKLNYRYQRV